jgi:hypothetical protein
LAAIEYGARAIELDVQRTLDGGLICMHDRSPHRTTALPAMLLKDINLSDLTRARLYIDNPISHETLETDQYVPELTALLDIIFDISDEIKIYLDVKMDPVLSALTIARMSKSRHVSQVAVKLPISDYGRDLANLGATIVAFGGDERWQHYVPIIPVFYHHDVRSHLKWIHQEKMSYDKVFTELWHTFQLYRSYLQAAEKDVEIAINGTGGDYDFGDGCDLFKSEISSSLLDFFLIELGNVVRTETDGKVIVSYRNEDFSFGDSYYMYNMDGWM